MHVLHNNITEALYFNSLEANIYSVCHLLAVYEGMGWVQLSHVYTDQSLSVSASSVTDTS